MSVRSSRSIVLFKSSVSLLMFSLVPPIKKTGMLKSHTIIVLLFLSVFPSFLGEALIMLDVYLLGELILLIVYIVLHLLYQLLSLYCLTLCSHPGSL